MDCRKWKARLVGTAAGCVVLMQSAYGQDPTGTISEPLLRVAKADATRAIDVNHPLDPAIHLAKNTLGQIRSNVNDYTAVLVKREQVNGELGDYEYMFAKVRNRKVVDNEVRVPFSVYLAFLKPAAVKGREVIYIENQHDGKLVAHEGGLKRVLGTHFLEPTGSLAMMGQRYPLTDIGLENLVLKLIERGERDRSNGECSVDFIPGAKVDKRSCTVLQVKHPEQKPCFDFYLAQVFIDDEFGFPVRYVAYDWPTRATAEPQVIEEYTYQNIKLNVGLTDRDFDVNNKEYNFHK